MCSQTNQKLVGGQIYVLVQGYKKCSWHLKISIDLRVFEGFFQDYFIFVVLDIFFFVKIVTLRFPSF